LLACDADHACLLSVAPATLVVAPAHLCTQWANEIKKFAGDALSVVTITSLNVRASCRFLPRLPCCL
jgi:SNF2 family DNA or RNA helicase